MGNQCLQSSQINIDQDVKSERSVCQEKVLSKDLPLTNSEVAMLKESWIVVEKEWEKICVLAFQRWFTLYPDIARLFGASADTKEQIDNLINLDAIQGHTSRFADLISNVLNQMDDIDSLTKTLTDYGRFHYSFGAEQKYATCLATSLKYGVCEISKCDLQTANAWDSLFQYLAGSLKRGIRLGKEEAVLSKVRNGGQFEENDRHP